MATSTKDEVQKIARAEELELASLRRDGTLSNAVTIWVVLRHQNSVRSQVVDPSALIRRESRPMITFLLHLLRLLPFLCGGHRQLALENLALRQQLAVYKRETTRPRLRPSDRLLWVWLSRVWPAWRQALVIVAPATVLS
jgi:hypothetical protein